MALLSVGDARFFLGNKLTANCLDFPMAVLFLPTMSPGPGQALRCFGQQGPALQFSCWHGAELAIRQQRQRFPCLSVCLTSEMCGQVPDQLCFPGRSQLFFSRVGEPGLEEASPCVFVPQCLEGAISYHPPWRREGRFILWR